MVKPLVIHFLDSFVKKETVKPLAIYFLDSFAGIITSFSVSIMSTDPDSPFSTTVSPFATNVSINVPSCCTAYSFTVAARTSVGFGPSSLPQAFRTQAEMLREYFCVSPSVVTVVIVVVVVVVVVVTVVIVVVIIVVVFCCVVVVVVVVVVVFEAVIMYQTSLHAVFVPPTENVQVNAMPLNSSNIQVTWSIPDTVSSQGLASFTIVLTPSCMNGLSRGMTQTYSSSDATITTANFGNLGESLGRGGGRRKTLGEEEGDKVGGK
jgi:hypothetical protein